MTHTSVLLKESIDLLNIKPDGIYVDATLGLGGHSAVIAQALSDNGRLLGLDVDPEAIERAKIRLQPLGKKTFTRQVNFRGLQGVLREMDWPEVDGILVDLGVSSLQLDEPGRGLSFQKDEPLDMRLDPQSSRTALSVLQSISEEEFAEVLREFGEVRNAKRVSRYLLADVAAGKMKTTKDLAGFCERVIGRHGKTHPATKVFLALRCLVNDELGALRDMLSQAPQYLKKGGRLIIISFHSLEDKLVKERFRFLQAEGENQKQFSILTRKPLVPSDDETKMNPRARSAKLRGLERVA